MENERKEDLNPRAEDIEEKVKRMLDPSIPDEPEAPPEVSKSKPQKNAIEAVSVPVLDESNADALPSAPVLPAGLPKSTTGPTKADAASKPKKVVIPISHDFDDEPSAIKKGGVADDTGQSISDSEKTAGTAPSIKKITITEHGDSAGGVAEQLDEVIAGLNADEPVEVGPVDQEEKTIGQLIDDAAQEADTDALAQPLPEKLPLDDPAVIADPETDKAVAEIVAAEGDELLEIEDAVRDTDQPVSTAKKPRLSLGNALKRFLAKPVVRTSILVLLVGGVVAAMFIPGTRYYALNGVGVRASSSLVVLDDSSQQPLKNAKISIGGVSGTTDEAGKVNLSKVKLGLNVLTIDKRAFAPVSKKVVVGWGSNPLGDFKLNPTGTQYSFMVADFLTGKPVTKIEANSNYASAVSDEKGLIKLTIDKPADKKFEVTLKGAGLRTELLSIDPNDTTLRALKLVPERKQAFVTKRSGEYDMYAAYIDGKDEKLVLAGSGNERDDAVIVPHPSSHSVAYVSTRAGQHNSDGYLLSNLLLVNVDDNTTTNIGVAERIQIIGWSGDRLLYEQIAAGTSANSPGRYRLMSYNIKDAASKELASSNFFNDVTLANGVIYYAPSSAYQTGQTALYKVNPDGTNLQTVFGQEVWNIFRTSYDHFALSVQQLWYDYRLGDKAPVKLNSAPPNQVSRIYVDSADGKHSAWVDKRDGKGVLLSYDTNTKTEAILNSQSGLSYPVNWLNDSVVVYRIKTDQETADYAMSIDGGKPVKIRDVTNTAGLER